MMRQLVPSRSDLSVPHLGSPGMGRGLDCRPRPFQGLDWPQDMCLYFLLNFRALFGIGTRGARWCAGSR